MKEHEVKQHSEFSTRGLWLIDPQFNEKQYTVYYDGYAICRMDIGGLPPTGKDIKFLLWFIKNSQQNNWKRKIIFEKARVLRECGFSTSGQDSNRLVGSLKGSLERWMRITYSFYNFQFNGVTYEEKEIHPIENQGKILGSRKRIVLIDADFLGIIKNEKSICNTLNFEEFISIKSSEALRLYEILKSRLNKKMPKFQITLGHLFERMGYKYSYSSRKAQFERNIKKAVEELKKKTTLKLTIKIEKTVDGKDKKISFVSDYYKDKMKGGQKTGMTLREKYKKEVKKEATEERSKEKKRDAARRKREKEREYQREMKRKYGC